jgi:hypothetical protein
MNKKYMREIWVFIVAVRFEMLDFLWYLRQRGAEEEVNPQTKPDAYLRRYSLCTEMVLVVGGVSGTGGTSTSTSTGYVYSYTVYVYVYTTPF